MTDRSGGIGRVGWRVPLRIARREALRHRGRSALTVLMIMLPVLAVTAADVLAATQSLSSTESLDRRLGHAAARVTVQQGVSRVDQAVDPDAGSGTYDDDTAEPTGEQVEAMLGGRPLVPVAEGSVPVQVAHGLTPVDVTETDLADPLTRGLFDLTSGRWPAAAGEVVVNPALAAQGYPVGSRLRVSGLASQPLVVGIARSGSARTYPTAAGPAGTFALPDDGSTSTWLVGGPPVPWSTVLRLNDVGATVLSRAAVEHPPPARQIRYHGYDGGHAETIEVLALIAVMALIEVVLLAGPAFAVGARQQQRTIALLAASGGTPRQARRVVLAAALVLGGAASVLGLGAGLVVARLAVPVLQAHSDTWFGPFDVRWVHLLGIAAFGLLSAFLAAVVPASLAVRQDVVAVLAGRRGDRAPSLGSPLLGLALIGVGVAGSAEGIRGGGELLIAASAIPSVLGMVLLIPMVLAGLGRVSGRLPLVLRYAVRDAARHRTRTVPAVAAVAATVAGVVALSIGLASDQQQDRDTYQAALPMGMAMVTGGQTADGSAPDPDWDAVRTVVERSLPDADVTAQLGLPDVTDAGAYVESQVRVPGRPGLITSTTDVLGATVLTTGADGGLPPGLGLTAEQTRTARAALAAGRSLALVGERVPPGRARIVRTVVDDQGDTTARAVAAVPMTFLDVPVSRPGPLAVLTPAAVRALGQTPATVGLVVGGPTPTHAQETRLQQGLSAISLDLGVYVERGYQPDPDALVVQWILIALGAVLMLGGTLTATFLALSDARPDLATLAAVGASPRTRRGVAAAYAVVVGLVGAVLGIGVGLIPGIAVTYPLTGPSDGSPQGPYLAVPWLPLVVLVVGLPLFAALVVGVTTRSRLPLVARVD